jgi:hypothetical protein
LSEENGITRFSPIDEGVMRLKSPQIVGAAQDQAKSYPSGLLGQKACMVSSLENGLQDGWCGEGWNALPLMDLVPPPGF